MESQQETTHYGMPRITSVVSSNAPENNKPAYEDIEVIDLDDPRDQIKPTTWHG